MQSRRVIVGGAAGGKPLEKTEGPEDEPQDGASKPEAEPVLVVIRGMPSAQHVLCSLGERRDIVCYVRVAAHFRKGMEIRGAMPSPGKGARAWEYRGKLPRAPGKW